jgi:hypothetical protein
VRARVGIFNQRSCDEALVQGQYLVFNTKQLELSTKERLLAPLLFLMMQAEFTGDPRALSCFLSLSLFFTVLSHSMKVFPQSLGMRPAFFRMYLADY